MKIIMDFLTSYSGLIAVAAMLLLIVAFVFIIVLLVKYRELEKRMVFFMRDTEGDSLEEVLRRAIEDNQKIKVQLKNNVNEIVRLNENMLTAYRKIGIVKYNAFPGMAGKFSSSVAMLNNEDNGIIINCMHSTEGCYTYVKEIMNGKSINPLTKEDEEALKIAMQMQV